MMNSFLFNSTNQASFLIDENSSFDLSNGINRRKHLSEADDQSVVSESLSMSAHHLNKMTDLESTLERNSLLLSQSSLTLADDQALSEGSYLGLFTKDISGTCSYAHVLTPNLAAFKLFKAYRTIAVLIPYRLVMCECVCGFADPPLHYFFWVNHDSGTLCWSRKNNRRNKKEAKVFSVKSTPSKLVSSRPDFSPADLHKHAFWVTTDCGVVNMLAYSKQAYVCWIRKLQELAEEHNEVVDDKERSTDGGECKESGRQEDCLQGFSDGDLMLNTPLTKHQSATLSSLPTAGFEPEGAADCTRPRTPPIASSTPIPTSTMHGKSQLDSQPFNPKQLEII